MQPLACQIFEKLRGIIARTLGKRGRPPPALPTARPKAMCEGASITDSAVRDLTDTGVPHGQNRKLVTLQLTHFE